jgi:hypothetical protein
MRSIGRTAAMLGTAFLFVAMSFTPASAARAQVAYDARKFVKPSDAELRQKLTDIQYSVTQHDDTETPFSNKYWDNLRYCMNSAAMRFIPVEKLEAEGYGKYLPLFQKAKK